MKERLKLLVSSIAFIGLTLSLPAYSDIDKPLLEKYAKHAQYLDIKISPNGTYLAQTSRNEDGEVYLTVLDLKEQKIVSISQGRGKESVNSFDWVNDERLVLGMAREVGALESPGGTGELIGMNADGSNNVILTGWRAESGDRRFAQIIDYLPEDPDTVLVLTRELTGKDTYYEIYKMKVSNGRKSIVTRLPLRAYQGAGARVILDNNGNALAMTGANPNEDNKETLLARESVDAEWKVVMENGAYEPSFTPYVFLEDNETMIGTSTLETDTWSIATYNLKTKKHEVLASHPKVDISPILYEKNGKVTEVLGATYEYDAIEAIFFGGVKNTVDQRIIASLRNTFKGQVVSITSATQDNSKIIIRVGNANNPTVFYLFDKSISKLVKLAEARPWLNELDMPESKIITYKSRDGLEISAVLTLPHGEAKDLPFVLLPHGGPHGIKDTITGMDPDAKVLASHGYAVLQPNYRGSGGYGLPFLKSGFRNWGTKMIDDMTDGTMYLVNEGIVDKNRMCVYGASYGGYAALQNVIREPDLYQCTIGFVGVYDLDMMYDEGDIPENDAGTNYLDRILPPKGEARDFQSPVKNVDKLKVPVFIIQGEDDQRVPKEQAFALKAALDAKNHPYEWMMKDGEGHGFYKPENNVERWEAMLKFLDKHTAK
ncbi:alpha/beta hydrolase family protein [Glaciecola sp. 1036]|uniref:alpha/beta hydrolase family protein n=1 Tax=Alteromonadaceae TaxID=72275 RepID=UPI003D002D53